MGNIRGSHIKKAAKIIFRDYKDDVTKDFLSNRDLVESLGITDKITRNRVAGYLTRCHNQPSIITPPYRRKKITNSDRRRRKKRSKKGRHKK